VTPIHHLLSRIRWDPDFGKADFEIGYYDRMQGKIVKVDIHQVDFIAGNHFSIEIINDEGEACMVPLHRIRELYRNSQLIWKRGRD
jgi:uncharacterized protein (UPF0248 family)